MAKNQDATPETAPAPSVAASLGLYDPVAAEASAAAREAALKAEEEAREGARAGQS